MADVITNIFTDPRSGVMVAQGNWAAEHHPAAATQASASVAAQAGLRNVCRSITVSIAAATTAQTPINVVLRDGATGAGTVLWSAALAAPANGSAVVSVRGEWIGSPGTAMTLEFTGAGVTGSLEACAMEGLVVI